MQIEQLNALMEAIPLLDACGLPTSDLANPRVVIFCVRADDQVVATAGIETIGPTALLRSVATAPDHRGKSLAIQLIAHAESFAKAGGATSMALLTTTAASFFSKIGYVAIPRAHAPACIQQSTQFQSLCPASANVMLKQLS